MKKLFCIILTLVTILLMAVSASADTKEELKVVYTESGSAVVGLPDGGELDGWTAIYLSGDKKGEVIFCFFKDGHATGYLCLKDGTSVPVTYENGELSISQSGYEKPSSTEPKENSSATIGMKNALKSAMSYLKYSAFSYTGLIEQLEYEKYSKSEATYAADNCGADWNEQAYKCAKQYLEYSSFSRSGLIEQLEYEGFTHSQAVYAADMCGY